MEEKYILQEILDNLTRRDFTKAMKLLPVLTGKCKNTIYGYAKIPKNSKTEIPYDVGHILEDFFGLPPRGLSREKVTCKQLKEFMSEPHHRIGKKRRPE